MAQRIVVWLENAKSELKEILAFFNFRNKNKSYSLKLHRIFQNELKLLILNPEIEKKTDSLNVRGLLVENYFIFYEISDKHIIVLSVWDTRQNPENSKYF